MIGDLWLVRDHGGPGLRGWWARQVANLITLVRKGRHTRFNHVHVELDNGRVLDAGFSGVQLYAPDGLLENARYTVAIIRRPELDAEGRARLLQRGLCWEGRPYSFLTFVAHLLGRRVAVWAAKRDPWDAICSELGARLHHHADGYRFTQRLTSILLEPEAVRPRDIDYTGCTEPWECVALSSHGEPVDPEKYWRAP